jgi:thiamine biosynthesis lipoprotein
MRRAAPFLAIFPLLSFFSPAEADSPYTERRWAVMGTYAEAKVRASRAKRADKALEAVRLAFDEADRALSNWRQESALSKLNAAANRGAATVTDPVLRTCLDAAFEAAEASDGAFDPTVGPLVRLWGFRPKEPRIPGDDEIATALAVTGWGKVGREKGTPSIRFPVEGMELDLGGIGKGCALDLARERLVALKAEAGLIDLGGNLLIFGKPPAGGPWKIGIRDPERKGALAAHLNLDGGVVATSGQYENAAVVDGTKIAHIFDARTGRPADSDVVSATAIAESGARADAASTALLVAGSKQAEDLLTRLGGVEAVLVVRRGGRTEVLASRSLAGRLLLTDDLADRAGGEIRFILPPSESAYEQAEKAFRELGR